MRNNFNTKLDKFLNVMGEIVVSATSKRAADPTFEHWPFNPVYARLFFTQELLRKLLYIFEKCEKKKYDDKFVAKLFRSSSRIAECLLLFGAASKKTNLTKKEKMYLMDRLFTFLSVYRKDIFCEDNKNIIWDDQKIENVVRTERFIDVKKKKEFKNLIYSLETQLWLYTELIWFTNHSLSHTFHGPYQISGKEMIVKKYFDLRPIEVWKFTKDLHFREIEILEFYGKNTKIELDFFERGIRNIENYRNKFVKFSIKIDGKSLTTKKDIQKIIDNLSKTIKEGSEIIYNLSQQDLIAKYAEMWFYSLKFLSDELKVNWWPPKEVYHNIYHRWEKINEMWKKIEKEGLKSANIPKEKKVARIKRIFDPRI